MRRSLTRGTLVSRALILATIGVAVGCGMRGPPLPPLVFVPEAVTPLELQRVDDEVFIRFDVPSENTDGSEPADLERVDVYALTTQPDPEQPVRRQPLEEWLEQATLVATIPVQTAATDAPPDADAESEERNAVRQGDEMTLVETLMAEAFLPVVMEPETGDEDEVESEALDETVPVGPFVSSPPTPSPRRTYLAIGISTRGRESAALARVSVTLADAGAAPGAPIVTYTEDELTVEWVPSATARLPIQAPATDTALPSEPILELQPATTYLVYAAETATSAEREDLAGVVENERPEPLNSLLVSETSYIDVGVTFGEERCYTIRALDEVDSLPVLGQASRATCVTPVDTFAPEAPVGVIAVASRDAISLVWDSSAEGDVAGYLVLRGTAPGATLQPLTPEPIVETTYRDAEVEADRRYVYVVQAVDGASPPNVSAPSVEVTEQAR